MLSTSAEGSAPYSNTGDVGVWLKRLSFTIMPNVGVPGRTIGVAEAHDLGTEDSLLRIRYLFPEKTKCCLSRRSNPRAPTEAQRGLFVGSQVSI